MVLPRGFTLLFSSFGDGSGQGKACARVSTPPVPVGFFVSSLANLQTAWELFGLLVFPSSSFSMTSISRAEMKKVCQLRWDFSPAFSNTSRSLGIARVSCPYPTETAPKRPKDPNVLSRCVQGCETWLEGAAAAGVIPCPC